jgi:hypothetical protein
MRRSTALVGVALVVLQVATAVVVNILTGGRVSRELVLALVLLVLLTASLVWWRERRNDGTRILEVRQRARREGVIERSPVRVSPSGGDVSVRIDADRGGKIKNSGVTISNDPPDPPDDSTD